ncbi:MAG: methyltransferase domain-containing protein [Gaiellaceae bacterium]
MANATAGREPGIPLLDRDEIERKALLEERHWWYRGRRRIVLDAIERLPLPPGARILDAGCGSGAMLAHLRRFGTVTGVDVNPLAVEHARGRGVGPVEVAGVERLPFADGEFDLLVCLDVLEHVSDDGRALAELRRVSAPGSFLIATVPAYPALWSPHDVAAGHRRRYRAGELAARAESEGWRTVRETGFNTFLLPLAACTRALARIRRSRPRSDLLLTPRWLDALLELPLKAEAAAIRRGRRLRVGLSLLAVFERSDGTR